MISTRHEIANLIREHGHRATPQRITIYEALWKAGSHPTVADIHKHASRTDPSISIATVYKTLHLFSDIGLVVEMPSFDGIVHYDPNISPHFNLICERCGKIEDYDEVSLDSIISKLEKKSRFKVIAQTIELRGICAECQNQ